VLEQQKLNPFESHDIAKELINKPKQKVAKLGNA